MSEDLHSDTSGNIVVGHSSATGLFATCRYPQANGSTRIYHKGTNLKLDTTDAGIDITGDLTITSTDTGSSAAPELSLVRDSSSPADADYLGQIKFMGDDDGGSQHVYAKITGKIQDASAGSEDGIIEFANVKAGSNTITARLRSDSLQLLNGTGLTVAGNTTLSGTLNGHTIPGGSGTLALTSDITTGIGNVVEDTTPQLGGNLATNGNNIVGSNGDKIELISDGTTPFIDVRGGSDFIL